VLQLWWGMTEQTYLYYWHHNVWAVLVAWTLVVLLLALLALIGEELWHLGYRAALRSVSQVDTPPRPSPPPLAPRKRYRPPSAEGRRFLAPPSEAFPRIRGIFLRHQGGQDQPTD